MKKILMIVVVMMAALSSYAQEMYLGGGISLWRDCDADVTSFSISPDFGYNLNVRGEKRCVSKFGRSENI